METDIKVYDTVDSTNTTLEEMADKGAPEGTCVIAFRQLKGQGRSGRTFFSPRGGNLYMSFLVRPSHEKTDMLTVTAAVATVEAIKETLGLTTGIKWVNDILYHDRKVCGIIAKAHNFGSRDFYVVVGIGINIYENDDIPADIEGRYGSLMERGCDLEQKDADEHSVELAKNILSRFSFYYVSDDNTGIIDVYRKYCIVIGRDVEYVYGNESFSARVCGIDETGGIILEENGTKHTYHDGEIRIRYGHDNLAL